MNTVNQTFNWSRFTATLRKEFVENKRAILFTIICIYGLLTLIMLLGNLVTHDPEMMMVSMTGKAPQMFVGSVLSLFVCVAASMAFMGLRNKNRRASYLSSPSSTLEKFLANILIYVVGAFVVFFACAQLADLTRFAVLWFFKSETFLVPKPINYLTCLSDMASMYEDPHINLTTFGVITLLGLIANAGLYLLGSVIWPRLSFLKTFVAMYAIEFGLFLIALPFFIIFGDPRTLATWFSKFITGGYLTTTMIIVVCVEIVLFFGLAWYLFKRKDIVSLKWWK